MEKSEQHNVLMLAGLGDERNVRKMELLVKNRWKWHGLEDAIDKLP